MISITAVRRRQLRRRRIAALLAAGITFSLVACGGQNSPQADPTVAVSDAGAPTGSATTAEPAWFGEKTALVGALVQRDGVWYARVDEVRAADNPEDDGPDTIYLNDEPGWIEVPLIPGPQIIGNAVINGDAVGGPRLSTVEVLAATATDSQPLLCTVNINGAGEIVAIEELYQA